MIEKAKVLQKKGDKAIVVIEPKEACGRCVSKGTCRLTDENLLRIEAEDRIGVQEGDLVEVNIPSDDIIKKGFLLYMLPAIFFVSGIAISLLRGLSELISLGIGFLCLACSFCFISIIDKKVFGKEKSGPVIIKVLRGKM